MVKVQTLRQQDFDVPPTITIVIPIKDRCGVRLQNCLRGIQVQTHRDIETIIVDYGSTQKNHEQLLQDLSPFDCTIYYYPTTEIWSPAVSKNIGIRRARGEYIATLDADCIMEPHVLEATLNLHAEKGMNYVETKMAFLPEGFDINNLTLPEDFDKCRKTHTLRKYGFGSYLSVHRLWWFGIRGCDERMQGWGGNDDDIRDRVRRSGYKRMILSQYNLPQTMIYHQWHTPTRATFEQKYGEPFKEMWRRNVSIIRNDKTTVRNTDNDNWGVFG